jgi:hypothetical protein
LPVIDKQQQPTNTFEEKLILSHTYLKPIQNKKPHQSEGQQMKIDNEFQTMLVSPPDGKLDNSM